MCFVVAHRIAPTTQTTITEDRSIFPGRILMSGLIHLAQTNKPLTHTTHHQQDPEHAASERKVVVLCYRNLIVTTAEDRIKAKTRYVLTDAYKMLQVHVVLEVVV